MGVKGNIFRYDAIFPSPVSCRRSTAVALQLRVESIISGSEELWKRGQTPFP